jgi:hypothetical protein
VLFIDECISKYGPYDWKTEVCSICNIRAGRHRGLDGSCPDTRYHMQYLTTRFLHRTELIVSTIFPTKKELSHECACGIFRADCDYHRE